MRAASSRSTTSCPTRPARSHERALTILDVALALGCVAGLARVIAMTGLHVPLDPNEGWNAYHALAAMSGGPLYPPARQLPGQQLSAAVLLRRRRRGMVTGDEIVAGRIVSLLSLLAVARRRSSPPRGAWAAGREASLFARCCSRRACSSSPTMSAWTTRSCSATRSRLAGLCCCLRSRERRAMARRWLMTLALFVKHNLVAMPLAACRLARAHRPPAAVRFVACGIGFAAARLDPVPARLWREPSARSSLRRGSIRSRRCARRRGTGLLWGGAAGWPSCGAAVRDRDDTTVTSRCARSMRHCGGR